MATLESIEIENYRSVEYEVEVSFPDDAPLILFGENNVGKSNIVRGLELVLGGYHPGNYQPDDHEFFGRAADRTIQIRLLFDPADPLGGRFYEVRWTHDPSEPEGDRTSALGYGPGMDGRYLSNDDRDTCYCVTAEAEDDLSYELSYRSKGTLLSKIMRRFHKDLMEQDPVKEQLLELFEKTKEQFYQVPSFADFSDSLRGQLGDFLGSMTHRLEVDFEAYNPVNFFQSLRLQPVEQEGARALEELGTGEQQVLAISLAYAYAEAFHEGMILAIEEPESHLHPLAQQWLANRLDTLAESPLQLMMTTHSPHFIKVHDLGGLVRVRKSNGSTEVRQPDVAELVDHCVEMGVPEQLIDEDNVLPKYRSHATTDILEGLFATVVVLVEGPTEGMALPVYLEEVGLPPAREGVAVIPVHGKDNLAKWRRFFTLFDIPTYVIFDNDPDDDEGGNKRHNVLKTVGIEEEEERDEYIGEEDWVVEDEFCVFGVDYEETLKHYFDTYEDLEDEAEEEHGIDSKPFKARWVAEQIELPDEGAGTERLNDLASRIRDLVEEAAPGPPADPGQKDQDDEAVDDLLEPDGLMPWEEEDFDLDDNGDDAEEDDPLPF